MEQDNTRRLQVIVVVTLPGGKFETVAIKFIILIKGFGDGLIGDMLINIKGLLKDDNIFRDVSRNYPIYRKLHRLLMRGTSKSKAISKASVLFQRILRALIKKVLERLGGK